LVSNNNNNKHLAKYEIAVGAMSIIIMGLVFMLAVTIYMLESGEPARMFPLVVPELWQATYGQQQQPPFMTPPNDTRIIDSDTIENQIFRELQNSQLEDYRLWANGTAEYTFRIVGVGGVLTNRTIELTTNHFYTPDRGYIYNSTGIFTRDGSQQLIIETFAGPTGRE
jgi:hypothetical protein